MRVAALPEGGFVIHAENTDHQPGYMSAPVAAMTTMEEVTDWLSTGFDGMVGEFRLFI